MKECPLCKGTGFFINPEKNTVMRCACDYRKQLELVFKDKKYNVTKFRNPEALLKFDDVTFVQKIRLADFLEYLAGYLLWARTANFRIMSAQELVDHFLNNQGTDHQDLMLPDVLVIDFVSVFFNKALPSYITQVAEERRTFQRKTWLLYPDNIRDLEAGFRENKEMFGNYLKDKTLYTFNKKDKTFKNSKYTSTGSVPTTGLSWKDQTR